MLPRVSLLQLVGVEAVSWCEELHLSWLFAISGVWELEGTRIVIENGKETNGYSYRFVCKSSVGLTKRLRITAQDMMKKKNSFYSRMHITVYVQ
jgi:hypothetical protein